MRIFIKYMVSTRCKLAVMEVFNKLDLHASMIDLGEFEVIEDLSCEQKMQLKTDLLNLGLELIEDRKEVLIEKVKDAIIEVIHHKDGIAKFKFSVYLSRKLNYHYTYLANVFSALQGITIEQFIIAHKIERIKELIIYGECNMTEIAWKMNYSSVAHLSNQFKKSTGLSPSLFKQLRQQKRSPLEEIGSRHSITQMPLQHPQAAINMNITRPVRI
ncbi:MAG: helix-turn-helix transcriptional regulator [Phycisphaerae bacterium]|nr:helix-turn-helix transcriptional regulator [Saprospiraceae bacterium]